MAAKINWRRCRTTLRHCRPVYAIALFLDGRNMTTASDAGGDERQKAGSYGKNRTTPTTPAAAAGVELSNGNRSAPFGTRSTTSRGRVMMTSAHRDVLRPTHSADGVAANSTTAAPPPGKLKSAMCRNQEQFYAKYSGGGLALHSLPLPSLLPFPFPSPFPSPLRSRQAPLHTAKGSGERRKLP